MAVACLISKKETPKIVEDFINISIHPKDCEAIITDLKEECEQNEKREKRRNILRNKNIYGIII